MARETIAEKRQKEVIKLSEITKDYNKAYSLMYRYYRLCGLNERLLYLENDERTANRKSTLYLSEKEERIREKLQKDFNAYNLKLTYFGYLPTIVYKDTTETAIYSYFYN